MHGPNKRFSLTGGALALLALLLPAVAAAQDAGGEAVALPTTVDTPVSARILSLFGLLVMMAIAWLMSNNRRKIHWRVVIWGVGLQVVLGLLVLRTDAGRGFFLGVKDAVNKLLGFYEAGANMVFGSLMQVPGFSFALSVLPTIIFFSSLMAVLYHLRVMQFVVGGVAWLMQRTLKTSGAESLSAAGNIFVGQTEAPLLIRPFVTELTMSELMAVMVGGFSTVAGGVMVAYVGMFRGVFPDMAGHLLTASIMSAPAALVIAKLMYPEDAKPVTASDHVPMAKTPYTNVIDAAATGAADGLKLSLNVLAMLLAFVALIALFNYVLGLPSFWQHRGVLGDWFQFFGAHTNLTLPDGCASMDAVSFEGSAGCIQKMSAAAQSAGLTGLPSTDLWEVITFQRILGWVLAPIAWVMGVTWGDAVAVGQLLGTKTIVNEFVAYLDLAEMVRNGTITSPRSVVIATYALCGFANFGSIAIQIGGIGAIAPGRRQDLAKLGLKAMIGGTLAAQMTATVAGIFV
ncbi:MAG: NupC/NupG family nucleoside CNT transporter [Myxococcales bacterium]|nr:NupC/NupG family nucleoside CNT transporter [Myxococcales bacterium]